MSRELPQEQVVPALRPANWRPLLAQLDRHFSMVMAASVEEPPVRRVWPWASAAQPTGSQPSMPDLSQLTSSTDCVVVGAPQPETGVAGPGPPTTGLQPGSSSSPAGRQCW